MDEGKQIQEMKQKLAHYEKLERKWQRQKEILTKNIALMQEEIIKHKAISSGLLKKNNHKRTVSDEQTFIFNQTNISSYYPVLVMGSKVSNWTPRANLRSHLDSVRVLYWQGQFLLSAGEDCLIKIWEKDKLKITVREHLAPIFTICGDQERIFSAGAEGVVRQWSIPAFLENGRPISQAQLHDDSIWQMCWNPKTQLLVTSSSDNSLKVISNRGPKMKQCIIIDTEQQTPTSLTLLENQRLVYGITRNNNLQIYNLQKSRKQKQIPFPCQSPSQTNKLLYDPSSKLLISGHEDRTIKFHDPSTQKCHTSIAAHSDSVTSMCLKWGSPHQLISCSHDGTIRMWDLRKYKCVTDIGIHMKKYDQSLLAVAYGCGQSVLAVGGADGQIKLFTPQI